MSSAFSVVAFAAFMFGVGWLAVRWMTRRAFTEYGRAAQRLERISSLSIADAESRALSLLQDPTVFECVEAETADETLVGDLAPELRKVLQHYATIGSTTGARAQLERSSIGDSKLKPGFVRIGSVAAQTDIEGELAVRRGEETIYEVYPNEAIDPNFGVYRSVYHWILAMAEEAR